MARALSRPEEQRLRDEITKGRQPTVWFTAAAVGVRAGASAKVLTFTEPAEGDYIQVRPSGSKDVLSFSREEITLDRPSRAPKAAAKPEPKTAPVVSEVEPLKDVTPTPRPTTASATARAVPRDQPRESPKPSPEPTRASPSAPVGTTQRKEAASVTETSRARKPASTGLVITLSATLDGEWLAEVAGARKRVRGAQVSPGAMAKIATHLPQEISEAVDSVLATTREQAKARIESLKAELQAAEKALKDLAR